MTQRISKKPAPVVREWLDYLRRALRARRVYRVRSSEDSLVKFAAYLSLVGPTNSEPAIKVFSALVQLLFSWRRIQTIATNLNHLPIEAAGLQRVAAAVAAAGQIESLEQAKFPVGNFITVALQLPDAQAYVEVCRKDGLAQIRQIFHPNTLKYTSQRYRGVVGDLANPEYREQIRTRLKTVT